MADKPWEPLGLSKSTYYRWREQGKLGDTTISGAASASALGSSARSRHGRAGGNSSRAGGQPKEIVRDRVIQLLNQLDGLLNKKDEKKTVYVLLDQRGEEKISGTVAQFRALVSVLRERGY